MNNQTIIMCVVSLVLGMLLFHMLKGVCGCKVVEGQVNQAVEVAWETLQEAHRSALADEEICRNKVTGEDPGPLFDCARTRRSAIEVANLEYHNALNAARGGS